MNRCSGPLTRRNFLRVGSLTLGAFGLSGLAPYQLVEATTERASTDTSVILLWLPGGPPHMETYDMKPDAPSEFRGDFRPIKTNVSGIDVCEHLPMHAKIADKFSLIRSIAHKFSDHGGGHKKFLTGRDPFQPVGFVNDHPMVGSMVAKMRDRAGDELPCYITGTDPGRSHIDVYSFGSAYLGPSTHPFTLVGDPANPTFKVPNIGKPLVNDARLADRRELLSGIDSDVAGMDKGTTESMAKMRKRGLRLLTSEKAKEAFDLSREPQKLRERYGMHAWGQRALLARRLVEHGSSFVTMVMENPYQSGLAYLKDGTYNWDSHAVNCHIFNDTKFRLPIFDRAVTALIEDLYARGLDKKVLLIVTGEFGRTPRINYANGTSNGVRQPGRDHWPDAMSVLVSGGGLKMGKVIGSTNSRGEHPKDQPLEVNDLWATMFRHLGIDYNNTNFYDHTGRPMPILPSGEPIKGLL
jgi:hypothetical protein